jgi:hypothetical protein
MQASHVEHAHATAHGDVAQFMGNPQARMIPVPKIVAQGAPIVADKPGARSINAMAKTRFRCDLTDFTTVIIFHGGRLALARCRRFYGSQQSFT